MLVSDPGAPAEPLADEQPSQAGPLFSVSPSAFSIPTSSNLTSLTPLVNDQRAILRLLELILSKADINVPELARRLGVADNCIRQYVSGRRSKPSLQTFLRIAEAAGCKVMIQFPQK